MQISLCLFKFTFFALQASRILLSDQRTAVTAAVQHDTYIELWTLIVSLYLYSKGYLFHSFIDHNICVFLVAASLKGFSRLYN